MDKGIVLEIFFESRIASLKKALDQGVHRDVKHLVESTLALNERLLKGQLENRSKIHYRPLYGHENRPIS